MKTNRLTGLLLGTATIALTILAMAPVASAQDNMRGAPYNGYTGVKFDTTNYHYDYLVDGKLSQDDPANKKFKTLQAAYAAAPAGTAEKPTVIGIRPDVYIMHVEPAAPSSLQITKNYITLLGLTDDRRKVVIADNRGNKEGATNNGYVLDVNANGFSAINLSVVNYANMDYEYPGDASKNLKMRSPVITQAVAMNVRGDKHYYSHVAFLSRLDTMFIQTTRSYFTNAYVEGTDDFLGGGQVSVFQDSEIYFPTGNGVMSASGITFINTVFRAEKGLEFHKGFRNPDTLIDCTMPVNTAASPVAWMVWKAPVRQNVFALTYHTKDAKGNPAVFYDSIVGPHTFTLSRELSAEEVKAFNPWNLLRATPNGVADDWDPAGVKAKYATEGDEVFRMALTGGRPEGDNGAGPFTSPTVSPTVRTGGAGVKIGVTVSPARAKNAKITWSSASPMVQLSSTTGDNVVVTANNSTGKPEWIPVRATAPNGFYVVSYVYAEPKFIDPPAFTSKPSIAAPAGGAVKVNYALALAGHEDQSLISWYLCGSPQCSDEREIAVSRGDEPLKSLTLTAGDVGKYVKVSIQPKHNISDPGPAVTTVSAKPITAAEVKSTTINPNFRNFVATPNDTYVNGMWTIIGTWTSSEAEELVNGYGLRVSNPPGAASGFGAGGSGPRPAARPAAGATAGGGARRPAAEAAGAGNGASNGGRAANPRSSLVYVNDGPVGDMTVKVVMTPEKTAGQGFGIAGGADDGERTQRADIYIKYDARTKTGYALRFWRTIQAADKCMFQLYKIDNGIGTPVNAQQELTGVFKPNTTITLSVVGNKFTVKGSNTTDSDTLSLEGTITPNKFGGAGVYWSGSVPVGNSNVYSQIDITYPRK